MPGMGASPKIFEYLKFPALYEIVFLSWIPPFEKESLSSYAERMSKFVKHKNPILIGVSFGGILIQEMTKYIKCDNSKDHLYWEVVADELLNEKVTQ